MQKLTDRRETQYMYTKINYTKASKAYQTKSILNKIINVINYKYFI